jgi:hypothetical protein
VATHLAFDSQRVPLVPERAKHCGRCRREYNFDAWERLELVEWMAADAIRGLVTSWPQEIAIEVRRCRACGAPIARKNTRPVLSRAQP